jgi:sulfoxide reductase heme-binding subunit YedZ
MERLLRLTVFVLCLLPFAWLVWAAGNAALGVDPGEVIMHFTGEWGLRMLLLSLLVSPLRQWLGWPPLLKLRRPIALYAFFYGAIHLLCFCHFYVGWEFASLWEELLERPYISAGFGAWLLMLPLVLTSTRGMQRRLRRNWSRLHRSVYLVVLLACCHLLWQARSDVGEALIYITIASLLLGWRWKRHLGRRRFPPASQA